jgi:hypothetical protein
VRHLLSDAAIVADDDDTVPSVGQARAKR